MGYATGSGIEVDDNYIYIANYKLGLYIYNKTDGALLGSIKTFGEAVSVDVANGYAFVANEDGAPGVDIVDVRDPSNLTLVKTIEDFGYYADIVIQGNKAYTVAGTGGLKVIGW